jgi:UDP-N-acetylmuramate dehydrogenase
MLAANDGNLALLYAPNSGTFALMIKVEKQVSLQPYNSFGLNVWAPELIRIRERGDVLAALEKGRPPFLVLGGGSNILWVNSPQGTILKNEIAGMEVVEQYDREALVAIGGGVVWQELVEWSLDQNLGGLENLSLIPGTVGAAPIQNIGAYGVELQEVFDSLEAISLEDGELRRFDRRACRFGYRDSIFKGELKGKFLISRVFLRLKRPPHTVRVDYGALLHTLEKMGVPRPGIREVSQAVVAIRRSKLPDPEVLGNAGSFFKNPEMEAESFLRLQRENPGVPHYPLPEGKVKVPAGWLIEQAGWKGKQIGSVGCYEKQALVIVNHGGAKGTEIWAFARKIMDSVQEKFGIRLQPEVNCL